MSTTAAVEEHPTLVSTAAASVATEEEIPSWAGSATSALLATPPTLDAAALLDRMTGVFEATCASGQGESDEDDGGAWMGERLNEASNHTALFFNDFYPRILFGRFAKRVLRKVSWPFLNEQVVFNIAVRDVLLVLRRRTDMLFSRQRMAAERIEELEETVEELTRRVDALTRQIEAQAADTHKRDGGH